MINTLPKPVLIALLYRLTILHLASGILPTIGADSWESEEGVDDTWGDRPVRLHRRPEYPTELCLIADFNVDTIAIDLPTVDFCDRIFSPSMCVLCLFIMTLF